MGQDGTSGMGDATIPKNTCAKHCGSGRRFSSRPGCEELFARQKESASIRERNAGMCIARLPSCFVVAWQ